MSFILDALKKSETDRQQQGSAEFAGVPTSERREQAPRWLWVLGILLAINVLVLLGLLLRPDTQAVTTRTVQSTEPARTAPATTETSDDFARQVAAARQNAPAREEARPAGTETTPALAQSAAVQEPSTSTGSMSLPTIHEVMANGMVSLPELHVDVHVYSETSEERFVFINMNKHTEGSRLVEGPLVREITRDGVVLEQSGTTFLLPRD